MIVFFFLLGGVVSIEFKVFVKDFLICFDGGFFKKLDWVFGYGLDFFVFGVDVVYF